MSTQSAKDPNRIILPGRLSFPTLYEPKAQGENGQGEPKFSWATIIDKEAGKEIIKEAREIIKRLCEEKWPGMEVKLRSSGKTITTGTKGKILLDGISLRDGIEKDDKEGYGDGVMFVPCSSVRKPQVVRPNPGGGLIECNKESTVPYAGCDVKSSLRFWAQDNKFGKRINAEGLAICFIRDNDPFGGNAPVNVDEEFAAEAEGGAEPPTSAAASDDDEW